MATARTPLMSLAASGPVAGAILFSNCKGCTTVRCPTRGTHRSSANQIPVRVLITFLSQRWKNITAARKTTWEALAEQQRVSPFNAYTAYNWQRWAANKSPTDIFPATELKIVNKLTTHQAIGHKGYATLTCSAGNDATRIGATIYRDTQSFASAPYNLAVAIVAQSTLAHIITFTDMDLAPGTYYYRTRALPYDGRLMTTASAVSTVPPVT